MSFVLGITSLPGSGATTVSKLFQKYGFYVISADSIAHKLLQNKRIQKKLFNIFGKGIFSKGRVNREKLRKIVLADKKKFEKLNSILHPIILIKIKDKVRDAKRKGKKIIIDAPLLFEKDLHKLCNKTMLVIATKENCIKRLRKKNFSRKEAEKILKLHKLRFKKKKADYVLYNNLSLKKLKEKVDELWKKVK